MSPTGRRGAPVLTAEHIYCLTMLLFVSLLTVLTGYHLKNWSSKVVQINKDNVGSSLFEQPSGILDDPYSCHGQAALGKWVPVKEKRQKCTFKTWLHHCCRRNQGRQLTYRFNDDHLNHLNAREEFLKKLNGRNITLLGDSMQQQFFEGFVEMFRIDSKSVKITDIYDAANNVSSQFWLLPYNGEATGAGGWLQYLKFYKVDIYINRKSTLWISFETINRVLQMSDVVIINLGLHYDTVGLIHFHKSLQNMVELFTEVLKENPDKVIILKSTTPQHFKTRSGLFRDYGDHKKKCFNRSAEVRHPSSPVLKYVAEKYGYKYYDVFPILKDRWDLHPRDCTHYCYTKELLEPQLKLLSTLL